uniref:Uncharacterized protein n=1 Tax=Sphaerodactylus townsendi TaxID=933632 RepID=A0ACB8EVR1_9SAUR
MFPLVSVSQQRNSVPSEKYDTKRLIPFVTASLYSCWLSELQFPLKKGVCFPAIGSCRGKAPPNALREWNYPFCFFFKSDEICSFAQVFFSESTFEEFVS